MEARDRGMLPEADVVIIGGGVMGVGAAHHLAPSGVERVVLLERDKFGEGSTSKSAGGVRPLVSDEINIAPGLRSPETFERFGEEFGREIGVSKSATSFCSSATPTL